LKKYEIVFVLQADEPELELEARVAKVQALAEKNGGAITERNHWGVRQLAYQIQHETRGNYMHLRFRCGGDAIAPMDTEFRLDHKILRHLIVVDEEWKERNEVSMAEKRRVVSAATSRSPRFVAAESHEPEAADD
jgi:small subunit ribosomal protein S6